MTDYRAGVEASIKYLVDFSEKPANEPMTSMQKAELDAFRWQLKVLARTMKEELLSKGDDL